MPIVLWQTYAYLYDGLLDLFTYRDMIEQVADLSDCCGLTVLDVGAGTGNVCVALVKAGAARVIAVDFSTNMLRRAQDKLRGEIDDGTVQLVLGEVVQAMAGLPDASVDRITAVNVLYALQDRVGFFREAARVLTRDGFVLAAHTTRPGIGPIVRDQFRRGGLGACLNPRLLAVGGVDTVIDLLQRGGRYDFAPVDQLAAEATAGGLTHTVSLGRCYGGDAGVNELVRISATEVGRVGRYDVTGDALPPRGILS